jgi:hypothetical protein
MYPLHHICLYVFVANEAFEVPVPVYSAERAGFASRRFSRRTARPVSLLPGGRHSLRLANRGEGARPGYHKYCI